MKDELKCELQPIAGGAILAYNHWNWVFIALACIGVILIFTVSFKLKETLPLPTEKRVPNNLPYVLSNFGTLFKNKEFMGYALTQGFITVIQDINAV